MYVYVYVYVRVCICHLPTYLHTHGAYQSRGSVTS